MREGYILLKSIETLQTELKPVNNDADNEILNQLLEQYHGQLTSSDASYVETITTLRQIQMNLNKFDDSCEEIEYTIKQQRSLFEQFIDSNHNILPDNLNQQIQVLKTLQREIETKTNSMIDTLKLTTKETLNSEVQIERLINENEQLKAAILVSFKSKKKTLSYVLFQKEIDQRESLLSQYTQFFAEMSRTQTDATALAQQPDPSISDEDYLVYSFKFLLLLSISFFHFSR
jgi:hypothetical protein